jgi:hypothetical protein
MTLTEVLAAYENWIEKGRPACTHPIFEQIENSPQLRVQYGCTQCGSFLRDVPSWASLVMYPHAWRGQTPRDGRSTIQK